VSRQRRAAPASAEQEHASVKLLGVLAIAIPVVAVIWQLGLWGVTAAYTSYAADEAARAASVGDTTAEVRDDALRSVPSWFRTNTEVSQTDLGTVKVTSSMPVITPIFTVDGLDLTSEAPIVAEGA
jgi:pilus assembly protein CpaE